MKKYFILLFFVALSTSTKAQELYPYSFSSSQATYQDLTGSTNIFPGAIWDDSLAYIPIGFNFKWAYDNYSIDSILLDTYGMLHAKTSDTFMLFLPNSGMSAYWGDLCDKALNDNSPNAIGRSPISYLTTGNPGNQILKIEFKNAGFYNDTLQEDSVNFQIWMYEGSNIIEYHYGSQVVSDIELAFDGVSGPHIGLEYKTTLSLTNNIYSLDSISYVTGDNINFSNTFSSTPILPFSTSSFPPSYFMTSVPDNGQVFRYTPGFATGINNIEMFENTIVYPSIFNETLTIKTNLFDYEISLFDISGKKIFETKGVHNLQQINTNSISQGTYFLRLQKGSRIEQFKLIKP